MKETLIGGLPFNRCHVFVECDGFIFERRSPLCFHRPTKTVYLSSVEEDDNDVICLTSLLISLGFNVLPKLQATKGTDGKRGVAIDRNPIEQIGSGKAETFVQVPNK